MSKYRPHRTNAGAEFSGLRDDRLREQAQQVRDAYEEAYRRFILVADQIVEGKRDKKASAKRARRDRKANR
jgi:prophage tail gpP-like protein